MFKEGDKVTAWNGFDTREDTIVKGVNGKLYLDNQDEEVNEKNIKELGITLIK